MDRDDGISDNGNRSGNEPGAFTEYGQHKLVRGSHSRQKSKFSEMSLIPESEVADNKYPLPSHDLELSLLEQAEPLQRTDSPSLLRRLTSRLRTPKLPSTSALSSPIPLGSFRSNGRSPGPGYENLQDVEEDFDSVSVDITSLSGFGFQITAGEPAGSESLVNQETAYHSPLADDAKPAFQSFLKRRHPGQVGDGLKQVTQLTRDSSVHSLNNSAHVYPEEIKRNKTVRDAVQSFAQKQNTIVAVAVEPVDLSFFEGPAVRHSTNQTFDTMLDRTGPSTNLQQSYFFPEDPKGPNWRPFTMSTLFILFLAAGAFALAGSQEYLFQISQRRVAHGTGLLSFDEVNSLSVGVFFVWKCKLDSLENGLLLTMSDLPTMITIIYAVLFSVMDFDIRRLEPFYQLSQPQGSPASESLNVDHLTMFQYFVPFKAIRLRQWTVFFSTIGNIIASTASPALQNPAVNFTQNTACKEIGPDDRCTNDPEKIKKYVVVMTSAWSRALSGSYVVVGVICLILLFQLRRKSGLLSDPKGIAGIASMATKSHILREFRGTDRATRKEIQERLAHRRFVLYKSSIWQGQWSPENEPERESRSSLSSPHPPMLRLTVGIPFIAAQVVCLAAVPVISLTKWNAIPNDVPWLPILVATILKLVWSTFEADVRLMEPFYQLSRGKARPENSLTLDYQATVYGFMPFKAAFNGHWLLCIVGVCSVALDVLSVTVSSFSVQADKFYGDGHAKGDTSVQDETTVSFWASVVLSMTILSFSILTTILVYILRHKPFLPREPSTIASVLAFIYNSRMLEDFIGTETMTNKQMERNLKTLGKTYGLGWFTDRHGHVHCAIDEEPMRSKYEHGKEYDKAVAGPMDMPEGGYY